ncbi:hypothetical protein GIB67_018980 [Kingdonia uniflora]|uniref:Uncharacterized protein n=1 Tax=Kingdonia uniflora TaxID=39325 RepID=A0A7J7MH57_9MAGN|nr:hypothetical protein GIB67_018980 [Kingdonia uniflora]
MRQCSCSTTEITIDAMTTSKPFGTNQMNPKDSHSWDSTNHRGAMMELGDGLCKLRKMRFESDSPFYEFKKEISASLDFIYQTQLELAACKSQLSYLAPIILHQRFQCY